MEKAKTLKEKLADCGEIVASDSNNKGEREVNMEMSVNTYSYDDPDGFRRELRLTNRKPSKAEKFMVEAKKMLNFVKK